MRHRSRNRSWPECRRGRWRAAYATHGHRALVVDHEPASLTRRPLVQRGLPVLAFLLAARGARHGALSSGGTGIVSKWRRSELLVPHRTRETRKGTPLRLGATLRTGVHVVTFIPPMLAT